MAFCLLKSNIILKTFSCLSKTRSYGCSAALKLDYVSEWETEEEEQIDVPQRGVQWVVLGHPMAKRHVYAQKLAKVLNVPHISMGTLVKQELDPSSNIYRKIETRSYECSSAAVRIDYFSEWETEEEEQIDVPQRGVQWVVLGHPMAKRHVYAQKLAKVLNVPHISMGNLVRQELDPGSSIYKKIANSVNQGKLVPEDIIFGLLSKRLEEGYSRGETGFILDGIPRTRIQAAILDQITDIDLVVNFKCTENSLKQNLQDKIYSQSQDFLSLSNCESNSSSADSESVMNKKLFNYAEQTKPLEDYYRQQNKLFNFQVAGAPGDTWQGLLAALHLQHMNTVTASPKLTL